MSWGNRLSLSVGACTAALAAALLLAQRSAAMNPDEALSAGGLGLSVGLAAGLLTALAAARQRQAVRRLLARVEGLARHPDEHRRPVGQGLDELAQAVERLAADLRHRIDAQQTHKRELEIELRICDADRQRATAIIESIADAVIVTDAFNELTLANATAARSLGFDLDSALRQPLEQVLRDRELVKLIKDARETGQVGLRRQLEHRTSLHGRRAVCEVTLACLSDKPGVGGQGGGEPAGVVTVLHDMTHEKEIAEIKSDFVSAVSHELRTPLSSIKAYLEMLIDGEARDERTRLEFYNVIQAETTRLTRLIDNILNLNHIEAGMVRVQREHLNLPALAREALEVLGPQARARQVTLEESITPAFFQVVADRDMIFQVLLNLLGNAIKYTLAGGKVTLAMTLDEAPGMVSVAVTDTGVGIPPQDLPRLFQKFYRVPEHKKLAKGTGLGLNLVKQIVEHVHGGQVEVQSQPGVGSTFTFSLPLADKGKEPA